MFFLEKFNVFREREKKKELDWICFFIKNYKINILKEREKFIIKEALSNNFYL